MILVTVGAQLPFDRLVRSVDEWAGLRGRRDVFGQIGESRYRPTHMTSCPFLPPEEFRRKVEAASAIVSHAGMGTILVGLELGKPMLVVPRRAALRETRNDHQVDTARYCVERGWALAAMDESELPARLDELGRYRGPGLGESGARSALLSRIRAYALSERAQSGRHAGG